MADNIKDFAVNSARWLSLEDFEGEVWKDIPDYEGWYQVSNLGRVKSIGRYITDKDRPNRRLFYKSRIIKQFIGSTGYYELHLSANSKISTKRVHRLVALAFIPNPNNFRCINHKDETRTNNCVFVNKDGSVDFERSNLEWCTHKYNTNYGTCIERVREKNILRTEITTPVYQYNLDGSFVCRHSSIRAIERDLGLSTRSIRQVLDGIHAAAHGFIWLKQKDDTEAKRLSTWYYNPKNCQKVVQLDLMGNKIAEYNSISDASRATGINSSNIGRCCTGDGYHKTAGGYKWEYK